MEKGFIDDEVKQSIGSWDVEPVVIFEENEDDTGMVQEASMEVNFDINQGQNTTLAQSKIESKVKGTRTRMFRPK